ncbi:MAG TPA: hypothetical protein VEC37_18705 [Bacillota bacterium]|nr:hypothetical protein [Bacillota bacterium]
MKMARNKRTLVWVGMVLLILYGGYLFLNWLFNDHAFDYGNFAYYLLVDEEVRQFPILGAKRDATFYDVTIQDGNKPGMIIVTYNSPQRPTVLLANYRTTCSQLGYQFNPDESRDDRVNFNGKRNFVEVEIVAKPRQQGSEVRLVFIRDLVN